MYHVFLLALLITCSYLVGSTISAIWITKLFSMQDPRQYGSKNPGTTNISRSKHPLALVATISTLLIDVIKGFLPVYISTKYGLPLSMSLLIGTFAVIGHIFPIFHQFRGGKGMATALGVLCGISSKLALANAAVWMSSFWLVRIASVSSILSVLTLPLLFLLTNNMYYLTPGVILICMFLLYKHLSNIYILAKQAYIEYKANFVRYVHQLFTFC